ncbi:hypothetical protein VMCG_02722 [Cytospora schulzeri]|uniref:C2H2-type domain-containing protein n=1 Tax=Cytospora schulzeri TaxID=448051 RepID=A0A423WZ67_9PEZI|nr:hypothetical protein VMCG_02722 [Valsa malicola]
MSNLAEEEAAGNIGHDVPPPCKHCGATFHDIDAMRDHKRERLQEEFKAETPSHVHLWCDICDLDFRTRAGLSKHRRQFHAEKQDLSCPGCGKHFVKLSDFIQHIELNQCPKLDLPNLMARMHQRMCWVKGLGHIDKMSKEDVYTRHEKNYYEYLGHDPIPSEPWDSIVYKPSSWQANDGWNQPGQACPEDENTANTARDDYLRGNHSVPDLLTGDTNDQTRGNNNENAWANKENLFPNAPFNALFSLAAHVESQSEKCHMRHSKAYGWFLNQLTWGTAEIGGTHGDNTLKYQLQKDFVDDYGPQKTTRPTYGHEQVYGPQQNDRSTTSDKYTQLTAGALSKLQQEMVSSDMQRTPYTMQRQRQQSSGGDGVGDGEAVPLTTEALSLLDLQDQPTGPGTWFQHSGDTLEGPSGNVWDQSSETPVVQQQQQQQQAGDSWGESWQPQQKQEQDDWGWHQADGSSYSQKGDYATQKGGGYMW